MRAACERRLVARTVTAWRLILFGDDEPPPLELDHFHSSGLPRYPGGCAYRMLDSEKVRRPAWGGYVFDGRGGGKQVEHRYDTRLEMRKDILVHVNRNTSISGVTRDISYGGLALETDRIEHLDKNTVVRAAFTAQGRLLVLPSQVVRINGDDVALMFIQQTSPRMQKIYEWLKEALRSHTNTSARRSA